MTDSSEVVYCLFELNDDPDSWTVYVLRGVFRTEEDARAQARKNHQPLKGGGYGYSNVHCSMTELNGYAVLGNRGQWSELCTCGDDSPCDAATRGWLIERHTVGVFE